MLGYDDVPMLPPSPLSGLVRLLLFFCLVDVIRVPAHHLLLAHPSLKLRKRHL